MSKPYVDPRHPHANVLVSASAGTGKTYQLSQRFLHLVAAGAAPATILTVTFTIKAAGEMRARILSEAADLCRDPGKAAAFAAAARAFHGGIPGRRPPLSPAETGQLILDSSQAMRVTTIDAVFFDWVSKFPFEAGGDIALPAPLALADPRDAARYDKGAFRDLAKTYARVLAAGGELAESLLSTLPDRSFADLRTRLESLAAQATFIWYAEERLGASPYRTHEVDPSSPASDQEFLDLCRAELAAIIGQLPNADKRAGAEQALADGHLAGLYSWAVFTKQLKVHGNSLKGSRREAVTEQIDSVEYHLQRLENRRRLTRINAVGQDFASAYKIYADLRQSLKQQGGVVEFSDLAKGSYRLHHHDAGAGVRFLLSRTTRHLLLDEFQDTSRLQWSIFKAMASELISYLEPEKDGAPAASVFIVGDEKQSIYGFREADPTVMRDAATAFDERLQLTPLTANYRTAQVVLDAVNACFDADAPTPLPGFLPHATALADAGRDEEAPTTVIPNIGRVALAPLVEAAQAEQDAGKSNEREAELVGNWLAAALAGDVACPVYDKGLKGFRALTPGDCAILYRSTTNADLYEHALRARGIPCERSEERGYFARAEVADVMALLKHLAAPSDLLALATVLRSPFGGVSDEDLVNMLWPTSRFGGSPVDDAARSEAVMTALATTRPALARTLAELSCLAPTLAPHALISEALGRLHVLDAYSAPYLYAGKEADQARHNLVRLVELASDYEQKGYTNLLAVLGVLESLKGDNETGNARIASDAVQLLTIHKAKGLEYPLVVVVDTARPWGQADVYFSQGVSPNEEPTVYYMGSSKEPKPAGDPAYDEIAYAATRRIEQECDRLLYVALTRPKQYLLITGHQPRSARGLLQTAPYPRLKAAFERLAATAKPAVLPPQLAGGTLAFTSESAPEQMTIMAVARVPEGVETLPAAAAQASQAPKRVAEMQVILPSKHDQGVASNVTTNDTLLKPVTDGVHAKELGTLIHRGLEAALRGLPFDAAAAYRELVGADADEPLAGAVAHIANAVTSPYWQQLTASAAELKPEMEFVHRRQGASGRPELIKGQIDLVAWRHDGSVLIVDFKTTSFADLNIASPGVAEDLAAFSRDRGYVEQLTRYKEAIKAQWPDRPVTAEILFTSLGVAIPV